MTTEPGVVVVGAGLAGANVVQTLREHGYAAPVTVVGDEGELPYERPPLSKKYLMGKRARAKAFVHDQQWYDEHRIDTRLADRAVDIDTVRRAVVLASGTHLEYQHLVLATGASPRRISVPGADLDGVHYLRRISDSDALRAALTPGSRCVVVGGGWIGLEVAAAGRTLGADVTVLEAAGQPLQRVLGDSLGAYFAELHRSHGVDVRTGASVVRFVGEGSRVTGVETSDRVIPADTVVVGVGVSANTQLVHHHDIEVDNGIVVDEHLRTSDPAILAAGDVANAYNVTLGRRIRVEHWDNAIRQGKLAAATIVGRPQRYDWQPYFFTDQYDLGMEYVGASQPDDAVRIRGRQDSGEFIAFWLRSGRVTAAMNVNIWDVADDLRALVGSRVDEQRLVDPDVPLPEIVKD